MSALTPYDTGARLEPKPWSRTDFDTDDDYGKVDFENDESVTDLMIYVERSNGELVVHIYSHGDTPRVEIESEGS